MANWQEPERVDAIYQSEQVGASPVLSRAFGKDGRRMLLGNLAHGDAVRVPIADIVAAPGKFFAPCGKPYIVSGMTVVNPCTDAVSDEGLSEPAEASFAAPMSIGTARASLVEMFGGDAAADKLIDAGYITRGAVDALDEETLAGIVGKTALRSYQKYTKATEAKLQADAEAAATNAAETKPATDVKA